MEKYFMKESGNELKFGDEIALDITREEEDGKTLHHHLECKFHPSLVDTLLEQGIITKQVYDDPEDEDNENENEDEEDDDCELDFEDMPTILAGIVCKLDELKEVFKEQNSILKSLLKQSQPKKK